jgi:ABC-type transport system involved in multi-copper enzyme maturation permease subunit
MTFLALLTKEMRLRLRRERAIWVIIVYLLVMGLLGFTMIATVNNSAQASQLNTLGVILYIVLSMVQLFLIVFIAPAFTATTINGEKERQTFDLLLCSRLSSFSLLLAKLVAGLASVLLMIAASAPLFSLVFFFGGVSLTQVLSALLVYVVTAIVLGTLGMFCSTILKRAPVSTAVAYMLCVAWLLGPWVFAILLRVNPPFISGTPPSGLFIWNPLMALYSTLPLPFPTLNYSFGSLSLTIWQAYSVICLLVTIVLFLLSMWFVKPNPTGRLRLWLESRRRGRSTMAPIRDATTSSTVSP